jgi:hypothetical protein
LLQLHIIENLKEKMMRRFSKITLNLFLLFVCVACSSGPQPAEVDAATKFFATLSAPNPAPDRQSAWGMRSFEVFGRGNVTSPDFIAGASGNADISWAMAGSPVVVKVADSPEIFAVTIPFWVKGQALDGQTIKNSRKIRIVVSRDVTGTTWEEIQNYTFVEDTPLTFWRQMGSWLLFITILGVVTLLFAFWALSYYSEGCIAVAGILLAIFAIISQPISAWQGALVCFGPTDGPVAAIITFVFLGVMDYFVVFNRRR